MALDKPAVIAVLMGMATGSLGGLMRDVVVGEVPLVLKQGELYITCAMSGAIVAVAASSFGLASGLSLILCAVICWGLRAGSIGFGWHLPVYKSRPPRQ